MLLHCTDGQPFLIPIGDLFRAKQIKPVEPVTKKDLGAAFTMEEPTPLSAADRNSLEKEIFTKSNQVYAYCVMRSFFSSLLNQDCPRCAHRGKPVRGFSLVSIEIQTQE